MTIDCTDSTATDDASDIFGSDDFTYPLDAQLWNGRNVERTIEKSLHIAQIAQFFSNVFQKIDTIDNAQVGSHRYDLIDVEEEDSEEIDLNFGQYLESAFLLPLYELSGREFALADPAQYQAQIEECKNIFRRAASGVAKCTRSVGRGVKKGAKKTAHFVADHKKEILIVAAVAAAAVGAVYVTGAILSAAGAGAATVEAAATAAASAAAAAAASQGAPRRREDERDPVAFEPDTTPPPRDIPGSENPFLVADSFPKQEPAAFTPPPASTPSFDQNANYGNSLTRLFENLQNDRTNPNPNPGFNLMHRSGSSDGSVVPAPSFSPPVANSAPEVSAFQRGINQFVGSVQYGLEAIARGLNGPDRINSQPHFEPLIQYGADNQLKGTAPYANGPRDSSATEQGFSISQGIAALSENLRRGLEAIGRGVSQPEMLDPSSPVDLLVGNPIEMQQAAWTVSPSTSAALQNPVTRMASPLQSAISSCLAALGGHVNVPASVIDSVGPLPIGSISTSPFKSCHFKTEGIKLTYIRIGFIPGMNTSFEEFKSHLYHIKKFAGDMSIEGVYNHSNGLFGAIDLAEIFFLNYGGTAPLTADLLLENWTQFHLENADNPDAKYLQIAHSMGTILTKDALEKAPKEIRDRVIVISIAPAVVIPEDLCYRSVPYACKNDVVHLGEDVFTMCASEYLPESQREALITQLIENKQRLILLEPHPDTEGMGHGFENPAFDKTLKDELEQYLGIEG